MLRSAGGASVSTLRLPMLHASPFALLRSGLRWLRREGDVVSAREPVAYVSVALSPPKAHTGPMPFAEDMSDLQVALAPSVGGVLRPQADLSRGGFQDVVSSFHWDEGLALGTLESAEETELFPVMLAGRRGFDAGEGRGELLSGWHDRTRAFWVGGREGPVGTVLSLGTCEQTGVFRGEDFAFLEWFARAPGPAQMISIPDERTVHSSAVLLQHLRRTPEEARGIAEAVHAWIGERIHDSAGYPAFLAEARKGIRRGRWPDGQSLLFALHLLAEVVGASPLLEQTELLTRRGVVDQGPPDVVVLSLGSEFSPHFRHRATGWLIAIHDFRLRTFIGPALRAWLKRDFEPVRRTVADVERDLGALSEELTARTGGLLLVQNLITTSPGDQVPNYSWLGDGFAECPPVTHGAANVMLSGLTRRRNLSMIDNDALAAELGVRLCPDRNHAARPLIEAQRGEIHHILRQSGVPGF